ncbi:MAG: flagellar hook assembly protein FlgD [Gammaproteobacteria bacterium]|nr:flagellar hook capping protein [Gammaproteobacteria bacterium]
MTNAIDTDTLGRLGLTGTTNARPKDRLGQEEFLELMVTQLRNQDPFKPMESGDFLGQIAQFGTVSGIGDVQKSLAELAQAFRGAQTLQAASLVDREVRVAAREAWLPPDGRLRASVDVPAGVTNVAVEIYDLYGQKLATLPVDEEGGIEWDGTLPGGKRAEPGFYEVRAIGDVGNESYELEVLVAGRVESVSTGGIGGVSLTVTGLGVVDLASVRSIA